MNTTIKFGGYSKNDAHIGIFDSGIGGLSIAKCIVKQLPNENLIYVADSLHTPYGEKSVDFIIDRVNTIAEQLLKRDVKALVIACNTATVNAITQLRSKVNIPIIGVEPAIKPAALSSQNKKIGILVTLATSKNPHFKTLVNNHHNGAEVFIQPCPGLVEMIEQGQQNSHHCQVLLNRYLEPLIIKGVDTLVLGCTHYPFVKQQISAIVGNAIKIIETAEPVALQLSKTLIKANIASISNRLGQQQFFSTAMNKNQQQLFNQLWQTEVNLQALHQ